MQGPTLLLLGIPLIAALVGAATAAAQDGTATVAEYAVDGREAWDEARRHGFEFYPVIPDRRFILSGERDGLAAALKACPDPRGVCETEAEVLEGAMHVAPPRCQDSCVRTHVFEMFESRLLAPGWRIARVELAGAGHAWAREPRYGTRDGSFAVRLEARPGAAGAATVERLVLAGPPDADWRRAFAGYE